MAVTTMACERCCLKYEKPVSQLYTRHPLPSRHLASPPTTSISPSAFPSLHTPAPRLAENPELFATYELQPHFPRQSSGGNVAAAGGHLQRPAAGSRGSAGAGEGPGAAVGGFDPHLLEAGGGGRSGRRRALVRGGGRRRRREGWSAPPSLALGVLTVPELKLSAAASALES